MSATARSRRFGLLGTMIVSALGLFAVVFPSGQAKAQACWGVDLGGACVGLVGPGYGYNYYGYNYGYPNYVYPYYGYPAYTYHYGYPAYTSPYAYPAYTYHYTYPAYNYPYYYYSPYYWHS
jgi:hypothetical protein